MSLRSSSIGHSSAWRGQRGATAVAGQQGDAGGQPAAGAGAGDDDPVGIDAQLVGVLRRPDQPGVAVLDRRRVRILRREPVFDRHHDELQLLRPVEQVGASPVRLSPMIIPPPCVW